MQAQRLLLLVFTKDGRLRPVFRVVTFFVCAFVATGLLLGLIAPVLGNLFPRAPASLASPSYNFLAVESGSSAVAIVGVAVFLRRYLDRRSVASLGLAFRAGWARLLAIGLLLGAGMQGFVFLMDAAFGYSHVTSIAGPTASAMEIGRYAPVYALVALGEEMMTRGYIFQNLWEEWGMTASVASTSAIFATLHLGNPHVQANLALALCDLIAFGVWACLSVAWTKSIWTAVGAHFAWNLLEGPVLGFSVSGIDSGATIVRETVTGPAWFTGGPFGPESGAGTLIALACGLAVLYWLHRAKAFARAYDAREPYART